jgi:hypothetical protein
MADCGVGPQNNEMQLTGGEGGSRPEGSPFGEPLALRSRRQVSPPAADLGVRQTRG